MKRRTKLLLSLLIIAVMTAALSGCAVVKRNTDNGRAAEKEAAVKEQDGGSASSYGGYNIGDASVTEPVSEISIDWTSGDITFAVHDKDTIDIKEVTEENIEDSKRMHWKIEGSKLKIRECAPGIKLLSFGKKKHLTVTLPKDLTLNELEVDATAAVISGNELKAREISMDITSGDIDISCAADKLELDQTAGSVKAECEAKVISIDSTSGSIELVQRGNADSIDIDMSSGTASVKVEKADSIEISGTSSDVDLYLPADAGFTADIDVTIGEVEMGLPATMKNGRYSSGDGSMNIYIELTTGDVAILEAK